MANTNASDTETYDLQTPSNVHVSSYSSIVTQPPEFGDSIDKQLNTPSQINLQTGFLGVYHHYHDTSISFKFPEATIPTTARIDNPMLHSPNRDLILASLPPVEYDPSHELKRQMFKDAKLDTKKRQNETACNPMDTMFNILRRTTIHVNVF